MEITKRGYKPLRGSVGEMAPLLSVDEALSRVIARSRALSPESIPIADADGRVLAHEAVALVDLPLFASSSMDGYAIRAADAPGTLPIVARVAAGRPTARRLEPGEAIGIATGGVVPDGADAVVPIEQLHDDGEAVRIEHAVAYRANIRDRGGDIAAGTTIARAGAVVTPALLAALAASGVAAVECARRPCVTILTTGTELRAPGETLEPGQIYESNGAMLAALVERDGAVVTRLHPVADDDEAHRAAIGTALDCDVLVTSGGVSVGPHDLVRRTLAEHGMEEVFWGVAMRPGKPLVFGVRGDTLVFGLPGNPVSSLVGAVLFVLPALRALQGRTTPGPVYRQGVLGAPVTPRPEREDFPRARIESHDGREVLFPLTGQESHMIVASSAADALVRIPAGELVLEAQATVDYLRFDGGPTGA
jgi:molybdopterin molybdotransferase